MSVSDIPDVKYVSHALRSGIEALNQSIRAISSAWSDTGLCETSTFDPPTLPSFTYDTSKRDDSGDIRYDTQSAGKSRELTRRSSLAEAIAEYLQDDFFADYSDVSLYIAPLRQAAYHSRRQSPTASAVGA